MKDSVGLSAILPYFMVKHDKCRISIYIKGVNTYINCLRYKKMWYECQ